MDKKQIEKWRKIKFHPDGSIELDLDEAMRQYRELSKKTEQLMLDHERKFGNFQKRPTR